MRVAEREKREAKLLLSKNCFFFRPFLGPYQLICFKGSTKDLLPNCFLDVSYCAFFGCERNFYFIRKALSSIDISFKYFQIGGSYPPVFFFHNILVVVIVIKRQRFSNMILAFRPPKPDQKP